MSWCVLSRDQLSFVSPTRMWNKVVPSFVEMEHEQRHTPSIIIAIAVPTDKSRGVWSLLLCQKYYFSTQFNTEVIYYHLDL